MGKIAASVLLNLLSNGNKNAIVLTKQKYITQANTRIINHV